MIPQPAINLTKTIERTEELLRLLRECKVQPREYERADLFLVADGIVQELEAAMRQLSDQEDDWRIANSCPTCEEYPCQCSDGSMRAAMAALFTEAAQ